MFHEDLRRISSFQGTDKQIGNGVLFIFFMINLVNIGMWISFPTKTKRAQQECFLVTAEREKTMII